MTNIQTPVTWNPNFSEIIDSDGEPILRVNGLGQDARDRLGILVADALNRTADLEAKLATAREAFAEVDEWIGWTIPADEGKWTSNQDRRRIDEHKQLKEIVDKALATISGDTKGDDDGHKLTKAKLSAMTPAEIAELEWSEVKRVLSNE